MPWLMNTPARHELPEDDAALRDLAFLMRASDPQEILENVQRARSSNRQIFEQIFNP